MIIHNDIDQMQGSEAWDNTRAPIATASEFSKIFTGGGKVSTQRDSYMRKCAVARKYKLPSWSGNKHTDRGHELEPLARDLFCELSGLEIKEVSFIEHDNELCGCSPDGLIYAPDGRLVSGLDIKCFMYDKHVGIITKGVMPTDNKPQVHGEMWLAEVNCWQYMPYHDDAMPFDHCVIEVEKDQYTDNLSNEVLSFCEELDRRAEEFISDFEKSMKGITMKESMPTLFKQLGEQVLPKLKTS